MAAVIFVVSIVLEICKSQHSKSQNNRSPAYAHITSCSVLHPVTFNCLSDNSFLAASRFQEKGVES